MSSFIARDIRTLKQFLSRNKKKVSCLVPTMGCLHDGHLHLVDQAKLSSQFVIVSIFLNPVQFDSQSDLSNYPKTENEDIKALKDKKVDCIFLPQVKEIYPDDFDTYVNVDKYKNILCGRNRKNHFKGVTTVVAKLFNIINPNLAIFGEKDYQQLLIIKKMTENLNFNIKIISAKTVRDSKGLAISSRNKLLSKKELILAQNINKIIKIKNKMLPINCKKMIYDMKKSFNEAGIKNIEYLEIRNEEDLKKVNNLNKINLKTNKRVFVAVKIGNTRLIDNRIINL